MADEATSILNAEQAVHDLLENLTRLRRETESYGRARKTLEEARSDLQTLAQTLQELAEQSDTIVRALGKIGTPEILARLDSLASKNQEMMSRVLAAGQAVDTAVVDLQKESGAQLAGLRQDLEAQLAGLKQAVASATGEAAQIVATRISSLEQNVRKQVADVIQRMEASTDSLQAGLKQAGAQHIQEISGARAQLTAELQTAELALQRRIRRLAFLLIVGWPMTALIVLAIFWCLRRWVGN